MSLSKLWYILTQLPLYPQLSGGLYQRVVFQRNAVVPFRFYHLIAVLFCIGLSVGVTIAVGLLLYYQVSTVTTRYKLD